MRREWACQSDGGPSFRGSNSWTCDRGCRDRPPSIRTCPLAKRRTQSHSFCMPRLAGRYGRRQGPRPGRRTVHVSRCFAAAGCDPRQNPSRSRRSQRRGTQASRHTGWLSLSTATRQVLIRSGRHRCPDTCWPDCRGHSTGSSRRFEPKGSSRKLPFPVSGCVCGPMRAWVMCSCVVLGTPMHEPSNPIVRNCVCFFALNPSTRPSFGPRASAFATANEGGLYADGAAH